MSTERSKVPRAKNHTPLAVKVLEQSVKRDNGCIEWLGSINKGYARIWHVNRHVAVHRFTYEQKHGPIPKGLEPDHICKNKRCINPDHLELVTHGENIRRSNPSAYSKQKKITHCPRGHEYTADNIIWTKCRSTGKKTSRICRLCNRERNRLQRKSQARAILAETEAKP